MAYTNPLKLGNGLLLDFTVEAGNNASDSILAVNASGELVAITTVPANRISAGGDVTETTSSVLTITGGAGSVLTSGLTIQVKAASTSQSGYLSSTDWNTFNNKLSTTLAANSIWIGNATAQVVDTNSVGDILADSTNGLTLKAGVIVNADINASAAIAVSKLASLTSNLAVVTDGSGFITTVAGVSPTEIGYLANVTSDIQSQFTTVNQTIVGLATTSTILSPGSGQNGYAIIWDNASSKWDLGPVGAGGSVTGPGASTDKAIVRWNSTGGTSIQNSGVVIDDSNNITGVTSITVGTAGLLLQDSDASHTLGIVLDNLTATRTLTLNTGDSSRTITFSGNPTLSDWFDQSVKTSASAVFADVTLSNAGGLHILDSNSSHDLIITTSSDLTADRTLTLVPGDSNRTLTINASGTIYVTGGTDVSVADGGTGLSTIAAKSIWVANTADTITTLTPSAGQSIRINAGGTAWEVFTPAAGGISGLTTDYIPIATGSTTIGNSTLRKQATDNYLFDGNTNGQSIVTVYNANTGTSVKSSFVLQAGTATSGLSVYGQNHSTLPNITELQATSGDLYFNVGTSGKKIGFKTSSPQVPFHFVEDDAVNSGVTYTHRYTHTTSGTPSAGIGVGLQFEVETSAGNNEIGATIEIITTDVTSTSEDFDILFKTMAAGATADEKFRITSDGRLFGKSIHNNSGSVTGTSNQYIASGTYTPTLTNVTNISASHAYTFQWIRVGNVMNISGGVDIDAIAASATELGISLPIASSLSANEQVSGSAISQIGGYAAIQADATNDRAAVVFTATSLTNNYYSVNFTYLIL